MRKLFLLTWMAMLLLLCMTVQAYAIDYADIEYYADEYADDVYIEDNSSFDMGTAVLISIGVGFVLALIVTLGMKSKMTTVRSQDSAAAYVRENSLHLTVQNDRFLYTQTKRVRISNNQRNK